MRSKERQRTDRKLDITIEDDPSEKLRFDEQDEKGMGEKSFLSVFIRSSGPPQIVLLCVILALALGSTVGVIPAVMTDRYARISHGYQGDDCSSFISFEKPHQCRSGSEDAQNMAAVASFLSNGLTFTTSALIGSISDDRGRKGVLLLGMFLSLLGPAALVLIQMYDSMSPSVYYGLHCVAGAVNWISIAIASLSDVMSPKWRAPSFGILMAGFSTGLALSPMFALTMSHFSISIVSLSILVAAYVIVWFGLPETLPEETRMRSASSGHKIQLSKGSIIALILRPMNELSILNRSSLFRLLSALAFFSGMVGAADQTLLIYYAEDQLDFNDNDVAKIFGIFGMLGIFVQGFLLKPINDWIGERRVIIVAFGFGILANFLYGVAETKEVLFTGMALSTFVGLSFPSISAIKSNNVDEHEQGRIQGALFSLSSLASAVGPSSLRIVYHQTRGSGFPGAMFLFASLLYVIATCFAYSLPAESMESNKREGDAKTADDGSTGSSGGTYGSMDSPPVTP